MLRILCPLALTILLLGCGCQHATGPLDPGSANSALPMPVGALERTETLANLGSWHLRLDALGSAANLEFVQSRAAADNDAVYQLPINNFITPASLRVAEIGRPDATTLSVQLLFEHPFRSSETLPRADLGVNGMLLVLADVDSPTGHTFFGGADPVIARTGVMRNAHGFFRPAGLLERTDLTATTFPYRLLVDDEDPNARRNSVTGATISNGSDPRGNFTAPDGWQAGFTHTWTGYDVLHQGQTAVINLEFDLDAVAAGFADLDLALIVKYSDPKSTTPGFEHRKPGTPPDVLNEFGYRFPHGSLDVSRVNTLPETGGLTTNHPSHTSFPIFVSDWDARAPETTEASLADEPDVTKVSQGAAGPPVSVDIGFATLFGTPTVIPAIASLSNDDRIWFGDTTQDTGRPDDWLFYYATIDNAAGNIPNAGLQDGLVRITDVEAGAQDYVVNVDGSLAPLTSNLPEPVVYQEVRLQVSDSAAGGWARRSYATTPMGWTDVEVLSDGTVVGAVLVDSPVDFGGGIRYPANGFGYVVGYDSKGTWQFDRQFKSDEFVTPRRIEAVSDSEFWVTGWYEGGNADFGGGPRSNAGGLDSFIAVFSNAGTYQFDYQFGGPGSDSAIIVPQPSGHGLGFGYYSGPSDILGTPVPAGSAGLFAVGIDLQSPTADWVHLFNQASGGFYQASDLESGPDGDLYACGWFNTSLQFGMGALPVATGRDSYALHIQANGSLEWGESFPGAGNDEFVGVGVDSLGRATYAGYHYGTIDYGGGPRPSQGFADVILVQFDATDTWQWDASPASPVSEFGFDVAPVGTTEVRLVMVANDAIDVGGGTHQVGLTDVALVAYNATTGAYLRDSWTSGPGSTGGFGSRLAIGPDNSTTVLMGLFGTEDFDPGPGVFNLRSEAEVNDTVLWTLDDQGQW